MEGAELLSGEKFLIKKFSDLKKSDAIKREEERQKKEGNPPTKDPAEKIANFIKRLEGTKGHRDNPEKLENLKNYYYSEYVIKPENVPDGYFEGQRRIAREQGHGDIQINPEMKQQFTEVIIKDQRASLDNWIDYFISPDADTYPMWAKYWSFRSMLKLSSYDKEKKTFGTRRKDTVAPFPDLNREALGYVVDAIDKKVNNQNIHLQEDNPEFQKVLQSEDFGKLYAYAIEKVTPAETNELLITEGVWRKYPKGSDHTLLVKSLQGKGTGWCTATGETIAQKQLEGGDFYVYYSNDKNNNPTIPRAAIRMEGDKIAEVRGIAHEQNLDPYINDIVEKKLDEFPDKEKFKKKTADMKLLTQIDNKQKKQEQLNSTELKFLYEIDNKIEGFGYQRDPRIEEFRSQRNPEEDMFIIFGCEKNQIARNVKEIKADTKAYVGKLEPGIFNKIQQYNIENIYTSFPEGKILNQNQELTLGGKSASQLLEDLEQHNITVTHWAKNIIKSKEFTTLPTPEILNIVRLKVNDLGIESEDTSIGIDKIYKRAKKLGLELCPAETAPYLALKDISLLENAWPHYIAMKPITIPGRPPEVFGLSRDFIDNSWELQHYEVEEYPPDKWLSEAEVIFSLRKQASSSSALDKILKRFKS